MPCDYRDYHPDWKSISRQIREQAGDCCEFCGTPNRALVWRWKGGHAWVHDFVLKQWDVRTQYEWCGAHVNGPTRIVLTVAHLDHDVANNDPANLRALCQRCHLHWDHEHHTKNAANTRRMKQTHAGQTVLV